MAIDAAERFLLTEVAKSTGLSYATVQSRMITLGNRVRKASQQKIDRLKLALKNDGFNVK